MTIAGLCGTDYICVAGGHADCRRTYCCRISCFFYLRDLTGFKYGCKRTDRCPENFLRYLRIQPSCHSFLYPGRKPDE